MKGKLITSFNNCPSVSPTGSPHSLQMLLSPAVKTPRFKGRGRGSENQAPTCCMVWPESPEPCAPARNPELGAHVCHQRKAAFKEHR